MFVTKGQAELNGKKAVHVPDKPAMSTRASSEWMVGLGQLLELAFLKSFQLELKEHIKIW